MKKPRWTTTMIALMTLIGSLTLITAAATGANKDGEGAIEGTVKRVPEQKPFAIPDANNPEIAFMVYDNFRTTLKWNRSIFFALAVGLFSDAIANR